MMDEQSKTETPPAETAPAPPGPECAILLILPVAGGRVQCGQMPIKNAKRQATPADMRALCTDMLAQLNAQDVVFALAQQQAAMIQAAEEQAVKAAVAGGNGGAMGHIRSRFGRAR